MDILSVTPHPITVDLKHPGTKAPVGILVECVSLDDDRVKVVDRQYREQFARLGAAVTSDQIDERNRAILAASICGWTFVKGVTLGDQADPAPTSENKAKLVSLPWVAKQIDIALGDETAFFRS